ncbi:hypothetical protein F4814DRAFT_407281 [Daldinia grandis]|nr:hypothetical protein F4814DRAFT_407281 [Daldinia grandis]
MYRGSVAMGFYKRLPGIICIATLIGCFSFALFHVAAYITSPREGSHVHNLKTQGPTNAQQLLTKAHSSNGLNHYEVLDIPWFSPAETVKKAYHKKLLIYSPDKFKGDEKEANTKIQQVREAYQTLTSKERCMHDFNLGSGIRHFVNCNQVWLDREEEIFNEKRKEAGGRKKRWTGAWK